MSTPALHASVKNLFTQIAECFSAGDIDRYYSLFAFPCLLVMAQGSTAVASKDSLKVFFNPMLERLRAAGYSRSEFKNLSVHAMEPTLALASMQWIRYRADDSVLETLAGTYTLRLSDNQWRIVVLQAHDAATVAKFG